MRPINTGGPYIRMYSYTSWQMLYKAPGPAWWVDLAPRSTPLHPSPYAAFLR